MALCLSWACQWPMLLPLWTRLALALQCNGVQGSRPIEHLMHFWLMDGQLGLKTDADGLLLVWCCFGPGPKDDLEESGWKMVSGDVFRAPPHAMLLCVQLGSGVQIITSGFITLFFAALGRYCLTGAVHPSPTSFVICKNDSDGHRVCPSACA